MSEFNTFDEETGTFQHPITDVEVVEATLGSTVLDMTAKVKPYRDYPWRSKNEFMSNDLTDFDVPVAQQQILLHDEAAEGGLARLRDVVTYNPDTLESFYISKTDSYRPYPNTDLIEKVIYPMIEDHGFKFITGIYNNGTTLFRLKVPNTQASLQVTKPNGDKILFPTDMVATIRNSYNGSVALSLQAGGMISICQNLFGLPTRQMKGGLQVSVTRKHVGDVSGFVGEAMDVLPILSSSYKTITEGKNWEVHSGEQVWQDLCTTFKCTEDNPRPFLSLAKYKAETEKHGTEDFDWFMALTNVTTFAEKYHLRGSNLSKLEDFTSSYFFGN